MNSFFQGIAELFPGTHSPWTAENMPDQTGRVFLVTGGNAGIGRETVKVRSPRCSSSIYMSIQR